jgi:ferric enterobactin receptor
MKRLFGVILAFAVAAAPAAAHAQSGPPPGGRTGSPPGAQQQGGGTIRGTVKDAATGAPLTAATVGVWSAADSTLVTGGTTRADGTFRIEGLRPGSYYLRVTQLGYAPGRVAGVAVASPTAVAEAGEVRLAASAVALEGISATAERSAVQTSVDRTVYSARDLPAASGGNATDVLRNVPAIEVDGDGKVSLRGNENVAIQINGRPAPLRGDQLTNFLKQLPANMVDRVEVVPNPSAKMDPEGMGGIINIVMKQNADLGLSGGVTLGAGTGGRYNGNGNLGYQRGPLTLFGSYGLFIDERQQSGFNNRENLVDGATVGFIDQRIDGEFANTSHTFTGNADLRLGAKTSVASSLMLSTRDGSGNNLNTFVQRGADQEITGRFDETSRMSFDNFSTDGTLSLKHTFEPQKHELSLEGRINRFQDENVSRFATFDFGVEAPRAQRENTLESVNRETSFQLDYTRPITGALKLETGYKGILRRIDNDFLEEVSDAAGGSNAFQYDENVHAGYALLTQDFGRLDLQAGLRGETVNTTFDLTTTGEAFDNDYTSLFPSAAATFQVDDSRQLRASYSKRVQRPDTRLLNPFPFVEDQFNRFQGNPSLKPEYTHSMELSLQQSMPWGSLQLSPYYRHTTDAIRRIREIDPEENLSITTFRNVATATQLGADFTGSLRMGKLNGFASVSAFRMKSDASNLGEGVSAESFSWSARGSVSYKLRPGTEVSWFQFYRAPMDVEAGRVGSFSMGNFSLRQNFLNDKASLTVRVSDPFDQMGFRMTTFDDIHTQSSSRKFGARAAFITFNYTFGQQPRIRPSRPQQPSEPQGSPGDIPVGN